MQQSPWYSRLPPPMQGLHSRHESLKHPLTFSCSSSSPRALLSSSLPAGALRKAWNLGHSCGALQAQGSGPGSAGSTRQAGQEAQCAAATYGYMAI